MKRLNMLCSKDPKYRPASVFSGSLAKMLIEMLAWNNDKKFAICTTILTHHNFDMPSEHKQTALWLFLSQVQVNRVQEGGH